MTDLRIFWWCFWRERTFDSFVTAMWDDVECSPTSQARHSDKHADCGFLRAEYVGKDPQ